MKQMVLGRAYHTHSFMSFETHFGLMLEADESVTAVSSKLKFIYSLSLRDQTFLILNTETLHVGNNTFC
jgi:hypothetical protein